MATLFGDVPCVDPASLYDDLTGRGLPTDRWYGRANSFLLRPGCEPGAGHILLRKCDLDELDLTVDQTLTFSGTDSDHVVDLYPITLLQIECVTPGSADDANAVYLCEVMDRRHLLGMIPLDEAYNLVLPDGSDYFAVTTDAGAAWTWQEVVTDIADELGIGPLTLPFTPNRDPENLVYWGRPSALACLCDVLTRIACALCYDPIADAFSVSRLGESGDDLLDAITAGRTWDGYPAEAIRGWYPETIRVRFPRRPVDRTDGYSPYYFEDVALGAADDGVQPGTYVQIDDDLAALGAIGTPSNAGDLATRASERAADWLRKRQNYDRPIMRAWVDFLPEATGLGGFAVRTVLFDDRGGPMQTVARAAPDSALEAWHPLGGWPVWWPFDTGSTPAPNTGITILSSTYPIDAKVVQTANLYTPPSGYVCVVTEIIVRCVTATSISAGPTVSFGALTPNFDEIYSSTAMTGLVNPAGAVPLAATAFGFCSTGVFGVVPGGYPIKVNLTVASTGTAQILAIDVIGYLVIPPSTPTPPDTPGPPTGLVFTPLCNAAPGYTAGYDPRFIAKGLLTWSAPAGTPAPVSYDVYSSASSSMSGATFLGNTAATSWSLTGLDLLTSLYYAVKSVGGTGTRSVYSNTDTGTGNLTPYLVDGGLYSGGGGYFGGGSGAPVVSGTTVLGSVLSCTTGGTWRGNGIAFTYNWYRFVSSPTTPISGATSSTYTLVSADVGLQICCLVTATDSCGVAAAVSNFVGPVTSPPPPPPPPPPPGVTQQPTSGTTGATLTVNLPTNANGDVLVVCIVTDGLGTPSTPLGWATVDAVNDGGVSSRMSVYALITSPGGLTSVAFSLGSQSAWRASAVNLGPKSVISHAAIGGGGSFATAIIAPSISVVAPSVLLNFYSGATPSGATISLPLGQTGWTDNGILALATGYESVGTGPTGTRTATPSLSVRWTAAAFAAS